jgi:hypothetical protein
MVKVTVLLLLALMLGIPLFVEGAKKKIKEPKVDIDLTKQQ